MISNKHKFIFFAIPKNCSTTIRKVLRPYADVEESLQYTRIKTRTRMWDHIHANPHEMASHFTEQNWNMNQYFKFAFVRNTWVRVVSMYTYRSKRYTELHGEDRYTKAHPDMARWLVEATPDNFKSYLKISPTSAGDQMQWVDECDFVGRFENLQSDFDFVCSKIGITCQELPHINKSKHKHYTEYYDDETRTIVAEKYAKEIEYFGYRFGE